MLDDFKLEQNIVYKTLINSVKNDKISHAYLIESNGYPKALDLACSFAKYLLCPNSYSNNINCINCSQCETIDKNEFLELKIIEPDGQWIKKSQLEELQEMFSKKSILGNKKIYIINKADKLNASSSNSILKFLEEPEEGIIAILIVENISQVLSTIISRCQVLSLKNKKDFDNLSTIQKIASNIKNNSSDIKDYLEDENNKLILDKIIEFITYYEENHTQTLIYINKLWNDYIKEKEDLSNAFTIMLLFYKDVLNIKMNRKVEIFNDYESQLEEICQKNKINQITGKINVIMNLKELIKYNVNNNSLLDKLIINLDRCE